MKYIPFFSLQKNINIIIFSLKPINLIMIIHDPIQSKKYFKRANCE